MPKNKCVELKTETIQLMAGAAVLSAFTYIPILARDQLGANEFFITLMVGAYATASFVSSYLFGRAGDIYGRRIILRVGLLLATISFALIIFTASLEVLFIVRVLNGFCIGMYPGALAAYAYESEMKMGKFASFGALGWGAGNILAGYAAGFNIYYAFSVAALFFVVAFGSAMTLPKIERVPVRVPLFPIETFKRNASVYLAIFLRHSSAFALWTLWPLFLFDLGGDLFTIGLVQAANSLSQVVFMAGMTDKYDCRKLVLVGLLATSATFTWIAFVTEIWQIFPSQVLLGFAWACLYVGALKYVTERNEDRSTAAGLLQSILSISGVIGPIIATILWVIWPTYLPIIVYAAVMSMVSFVIFYFNGKDDSCVVVTTVSEVD